MKLAYDMEDRELRIGKESILTEGHGNGLWGKRALSEPNSFK